MRQGRALYSCTLPTFPGVKVEVGESHIQQAASVARGLMGLINPQQAKVCLLQLSEQLHFS